MKKNIEHSSGTCPESTRPFTPYSRKGLNTLFLTTVGLVLGVVLALGFYACGQGGSVIHIESQYTAIGSQFAPTLLIPDQAGLRNRAFVQTASLPLKGIYSFQLDKMTPPLPFDFFDMSKPLPGMSEPLKGIPDALNIQDDKDLAFVTTSGKGRGCLVV